MNLKLLTGFFALCLVSCGGGGSQPDTSIQVSAPTPSVIGPDNRLLFTTDVPYVCHTGFVSYGDDWIWIFKSDGTITDELSTTVGTWQEAFDGEYWLQTDRVPTLTVDPKRRTLALNHTFDSETGEGGERYGTCRRDL